MPKSVPQHFPISWQPFNPNPGVRWCAVNGLLYLGPNAHAALPVLSGALHDEDSEVREVAEKAIKVIKPK
jgi:hypothetical protein